MANAILNGPRYKYATIDTAPGVDGYWCDSVSMAANNVEQLFWSRRGEGTGTITIQFRCPGDTGWTDYVTDEALATGERHRLDDEAAGVRWRTGIKSGGHSSGSVTVGFDW